MIKAEGSDRDLNNRSMSVRGHAPTVSGCAKCSFYARLRLIEDIINECMVAPNVHKRVLCNENIRSAHQRIEGRIGRETDLCKPGF